MGKTEDLAKLRRILKAFADIIRESDGTTEPIAVSDMRQRIAAADYATFNVNNGILSGHASHNGSEDPSIPENTLEYYTKLITNFADKVRIGSEELDIDDIDNEKYSICGINKINDKYTLRLPPNVTSIGSSAFYYSTYVTGIQLPVGLTTIGDKAFGHANSLSDINIPNTVTSFGASAFQSTALTNIDIPNSVHTIGNYCFQSCSVLKTAFLPNNISNFQTAYNTRATTI